ncbi:peptide deformylase [Brevibacterium sp. 91QC2O2]|jgi:peptide deformylase|uniref:peptide deformylase n=1 Tax=Brevibacterium sp. 91QC2O2 TaxID=2968458 RepID=UPI00211C765C|nr:peptide deformylase [Brevibacterium sp. 91QC2O2]MCQ9366699.1 peptide deformylase [Brevibacterium sp. 91QC2O2]
MPDRSIRVFGDPVLRQICEPVVEFDEAARRLAEDLIETSLPAGRAAVAAPQIGVPLQAFGYDVDGRRGAVFNPVVVETGGELRDIDEGCLSVPELWFPTPRWEYARVTGLDATGEPVDIDGEGVFAQMLQHETDHLKGIVYVQTLPRERRREAMRSIRTAPWFLAGSQN